MRRNMNRAKARLRKRGQHKEAHFLMACLKGALWPLQMQHDCPRKGGQEYKYNYSVRRLHHRHACSQRDSNNIQTDTHISINVSRLTSPHCFNHNSGCCVVRRVHRSLWRSRVLHAATCSLMVSSASSPPLDPNRRATPVPTPLGGQQWQKPVTFKTKFVELCLLLAATAATASLADLSNVLVKLWTGHVHDLFHDALRRMLLRSQLDHFLMNLGPLALLISASAEDWRQLSHRLHEAKLAPHLQESILGRSGPCASRRWSHVFDHRGRRCMGRGRRGWRRKLGHRSW